MSLMPTVMPFPAARGLSSPICLTTLLTRLLAACLPLDLWSIRAGRGTPTATEFRGFCLISMVGDTDVSSVDWVFNPAILATECLREVGLSRRCGGGAVLESMMERRKRLAFSRGPASFSMKYDLLLVGRPKAVGSGGTAETRTRCGRRCLPWKKPLQMPEDGRYRYSGM